MNANLIHKWVKNPRFAPEADSSDEVLEGAFLPVEVAVSSTVLIDYQTTLTNSFVRSVLI